MRTITKKATDAFLNFRPFREGNTQVTTSSTGASMMVLHGSVIATNEQGIIKITTAGYETATTKERLKGIPGVSLHTKDGVLFLNGKGWDGDWQKI